MAANTTLKLGGEDEMAPSFKQEHAGHVPVDCVSQIVAVLDFVD